MLKSRNKFSVGLNSLVKSGNAVGREIVCSYHGIARAGHIVNCGETKTNGPFVTIEDIGKGNFRTLSLKKMKLTVILPK